MVLRAAGCTAAGTWRAGAPMGFWSLWGVRTIRLRYAASALSLGDRGRAGWARERVTGCGCCAFGSCGGRAACRLCCFGGWLASGCGGVAFACWGAATRLHGAVSDRCIGAPAADGEREA